MNYHELLKHYISESGWSMREISKRCRKKGICVSQSYLSQLTRGKAHPASDKINRVLGELLSLVTDMEKDELFIASYKMKIPSDVLEVITS